MKIVVCVKQIFHTYTRTGMNPGAHYLSPEDGVFRINSWDELAVGMALRTRALVGEGTIALLTLGPLIAEGALRNWLAQGADRLCQIDMAETMDPWQKSAFLAKAIRDMGADLVLCGKESLDTRNGQVGAFLGHHLGMPFVSCIRDMALSKEEGILEVERSAGRGFRERIACPLPAVLSVEMCPGELPLPTYEEKKRCQSLPIQKFSYDKTAVAPKVVHTKTFPPRPRPKTVPPPDSRRGAYDRTLQLFAGSLVEKKGEMLTGSPQSQVEAILNFLKKHDLLGSKNKSRGD